MTINDALQIALAEVGCLFMTMWGIWSINKYDIAFVDFNGFVISILAGTL
jgi:hypothetical protein